MVKTLKFLLASTLIAVALLFACNKAEDVLSTDEAIDETLYAVQERGGLGSYGCYELLFPVTIQLPNGTTAEVNSYEEIAQKLRAYFEASGRPKRGQGVRHAFSFVFPISVVSQSGEIIVVESEEQLRQLRARCAGSFGHRGPNGHGKHGVACFEFVFPITILFPDGTSAQAANPRAMKQLLHTWKRNNPGATERPTLAFPLQVKMRATGEIITVNNADELAAVKNSCQ